MRREHLDVVGEREEPLHAPVLFLGAFAAAEVRPSDITDEQGVAAEHHRWFRAARRVGDDDRDGLGAVSRRVHDAQDHLTNRYLIAVVDGREREGDAGLLVQVERGAGGGGQRAVAGDVVGVDMGIDDADDAVVALAGEVEVRLDVELRVDDDGLARVA